MYSVFMEMFSVNCEFTVGSVSNGESSVYRMIV